MEALNEMSRFIADKTAQHFKVSMKSLMERFTKAPYGYVEADVQWLVAKLFRKGEISLTVNNEQVTLQSRTSEEIFRFITRKEYIEKLMAEKRAKASDNQKKVVREVMKELFNTTPNSDDDDAVMAEFVRYANNLKTEIERTEGNYNNGARYPGRRVLSKAKQLLTDICDVKYPNEFFGMISAKKEDLLNMAEDYEPVKKFFGGQQKSIFYNAVRQMDIFESSKTFIVNDEVEGYVSQINTILNKSEPYNEMHKLPDLIEKYLTAYNAELDKHMEPALEAVDEARRRVFDELDGKECRPQLSDKFVKSFSDLSDKAQACDNIANLKNISVEADALMTRSLNEIFAAEKKIADSKAAKITPPIQPEDDAGAAPVQPVAPVVPKMKKRKAVSIKSLNSSSSWQLESAADVDKYLADLKNKLMNTLEEDTIITIEF